MAIVPYGLGFQDGRKTMLDDVLKVIEGLEAKETYCFTCSCGFDEDSDECFRCDGKNIEHRELDISREELIKKLEAQSDRSASGGGKS